MKSLTSKKHAHDKQMEKAKEKEGHPNKPMDKVVEKRKPDKDHTNRPLRRKAKKEKFPLDLGKGDRPAQKSAAKGCQKSPKKPQDREKHIQKASTKLEKKEKGEKAEETKKHKSKEKPLIDGQSGRMRQLSKAAVQKGDEGASGKITYQKACITRMTTHSFLSVMAQLNEAQAEAVRSMGFASFLKVNMKQIPGKLPDREEFLVTTFNVHVTLGVRLGGREIIEITKSSMDEEYDEVHAMWLKEWKVQQNASELT
ncbi:hypothetical protein Cgig2_004222 [Carnegiea gigantea]|uniref:Uncharacterized protein n=1 Tax=Carnegiea gigantea TaxID=171969 RepID=A0A9Q1JNA2_9CARY|nr:hypothetical protein Cgig2_004222 [Carnegiea gigantea]